MSEYKCCITSLKRLEDGGMKIRMEIPSVDHEIAGPFKVTVVTTSDAAKEFERYRMIRLELNFVESLNKALIGHLADLKQRIDAIK